MSVYNRRSVQDRSVSAALLSDLGPGMHPRISIRGGQFALVDAAGIRYGAPVILRNTLTGQGGQKVVMLGVIVGSNPKKSRVFYGSKYDPDNPGPPDCFSDNGLAPSAGSSEPQARTCAECNWSKWGSDTSQLTGKKTKACDEKKKIGVIVVNDPTGLTYELQIPPATLKNMAVYAATLAQGSPPGEQRKADVSDMVTAFSFVPGQTGTLTFEPFAWLQSAYIDQNGTLCVAVDQNQQPLAAPDNGDSVGDRIDDIWESNELDGLLGLKDMPWTPPPNIGPLPGMQGYLEHGGVPQRGTVPASTSVQHGLPSHPTAGAAVPPLAGSPYSPPNLAAAPAHPASHIPPAVAASPHTPAATAQPPAAASVPATTPRARRTRAPAAGNAPLAAQGGAPQPGNVTVFPPASQPQQSHAPADIPDFLRRGAASNPPVPQGAGVQSGGGPAPNPTPNGGAAYGMVSAGAPPAGIENVLDAAFKLNTTRT